MALTAIAPSGLSRDLSWDESIVPALRKRLESESHALSKRMSAASIASSEDPPQNGLSSNASYVVRDRTTTPTMQAPRPSAIPRPSLQQSRTPEPSSAIDGRGSRSGSFQRNRTLSQPFPVDRPGPSSNPPPPPGPSSRAASPMVSASRSTRIPISRARTGSMSSAKQQSSNGSIITVRTDSRNGTNRTNGVPYQTYPEPVPDLWPVTEVHQLSAANSRSTIRTPQTQNSELVNEKAPFDASFVSSRSGYDADFPRMSAESEERPFEHWYRGDVSRNGGVGELRVGKRQEMLDIANYGHPLRESSSKTALSGSRSRSNSRGRDPNTSPYTHRPRAESFGARESIYMDDDERINQASMVLDERPPTDLDSHDEGYYDEDPDYYDEERTTSFGQETGTTSPPLSLDRSDTPTTLVEASRSANFKSRIPTPTPRQISETSQAVTPTQSSTLINVESSTSKAKLPVQQPAQKLNPNPNQGSNNKRRAKSPAAAASSMKKTRTKPPAKPQPKKKEEARKSVAYYPTPEGDDMIHAIPSWTQPVPPSGNWDDAVLPVVARKKGLEGQYQQADGGPRPPKPRVTIPEPAPGTFGFRYRERDEMQRESVPMDDFGHHGFMEDTQPPEPEKLSTPVSSAPRMRSPTNPRAESPAPFSQYPASTPPPVPQIQITRPSSETQKQEMQMEEEREAGCCKCTIM